jgi:hypothetical protein
MTRLIKVIPLLVSLVVVLLSLPLNVNVVVNAAVGAAVSAALAPPNDCVGIASDSNAFGHVTFQIPPAPDGQVGIIYIQPFRVILRQELDKLGLNRLAIVDKSMVASGLTSGERTNYLKSGFYGDLIRARCKFAIVGPFLPDVAANKATPENYMVQLAPLVGGLINDNPTITIFVLGHYQTSRAEFTASNNGFGMRPDRINEFIKAFKDICKPDHQLGQIPQVICVDTQKIFDGMKVPYVLKGANRDEFKRLVFGNTGFRPTVEEFFKNNPTARLIGDGLHLSLEGRMQLMQALATMISVRNTL